MEKSLIENSRKYIIPFIAIIFSLGTLYLNIFGTIPGMVLRAIHLMFASTLCFTLWPVAKSFSTGRKLIINNILTGILIIGSLTASIYIAYKS